MFALPFFLLFFTALPSALAKPKLAGELAGDAAYRQACERKFAEFEQGIVSRRSQENPIYDKEARLRRRHAVFAEISDKQNAAFIQIARRANVENTEAKIFLDLENAVLKALNDKVVLDKDLATALTNLHKDLVWQHFSSDPEIAPHIIAQYSDFKSVRLAFSADNPQIRKHLEEKIFLLNKKYSDYLESLAHQHDWGARASGISAERRSWFHAGLGLTPDEAGLASRVSRELEGPARLQNFNQAQLSIAKAARKAELYQEWLAKRFSGVEGLLVDAGNGKMVLSSEAIESVRKVNPKVNTPKAHAEAIQEIMRLRFKLNLSEKEAGALKDYLDAADKFSPGLLLEARVVIDMAQESAAVISADFKGQNARNLEETLKALARTEGRPLVERVREVRRGEKIATDSLEMKKARFQLVVNRIAPGTKAEFSGDDGIGFLSNPLSPKQKKLFAHYWAEAGGQAEDLRLTFEELRYADTGAVIPPDARSALIVSAESIEKKLRAALIRDLPRRDLNDLQIAVSLRGREQGPSSAALLLTPARPLPSAIKARVKKIVEEAGFAVDDIEINPLN